MTTTWVLTWTVAGTTRPIAILERAVYVRAEWRRRSSWNRLAVTGLIAGAQASAPLCRRLRHAGAAAAIPTSPGETCRLHHVSGRRQPVATLCERLGKRYRLQLVVDGTGVGAAVVDMFESAGLRPLAVTITGGNEASIDGAARRASVPKRDIVNSSLVLLQSERLRIAESLLCKDELVKELLAFRRKVSLAGRDTYANEWREAAHDDLVLALGLATWFREFWNLFLDNGLCWRLGGPRREVRKHAAPGES